MKRVVFWGIWLAMLLLRVGTLQGQSYTMTNGQTITTCSGTFYDPGGPNGSYDDRLDYMQTFISASPDKCLKVTFSSFETESCCDKLYVYDGDTVSGTLIGTYSGTNTPFSVISTTGVLTFLFHSDYSIVKSGWEATISCVECSLPPLVEPYYSMHYGTDTINCLSPPRPFYDPGGIDEDYSGNSHYVQTFVSSDPNRCLTVTFTDFATEMYFDKLFVYDGDSPSGIILGVYTGYLGGFSVTSVTGALTFVFDSDSSYNETGWVATVSCSDCDDLPVPTNNMHYGTDTIYCSQDPRPFYDPGGPDGDYDDHLDYVQTFVLSEPDSCLQVTFTSIDIADWNGLYVHDGTSTSGTLLGVLTGIDSNVTIVSTTGALTFHFLPYYGFGAGWEAVISCMSCPSPPLPPLPPPSNPCSPDGIRPFCTDENPYGITYASGTSGESASSFLGSSQYSCLFATPNPAWYYMQIDDPGDLLIYIQQVSATGTGLDVDFVCWGPFVASSQNDFVNKLCNGDYTLGTYTNGSHHPTNGNHQNDMGGYPGGNVIDCSYSIQSTEWCFIPNAQQGEWYLFLITNYSGQHGSITFNLVDEYSFATTNCNLLVPFSYNEPICEGDTLVLTCENPLSGAIYNWSGPGGWTAVTTDPFVNIPNVSAGHSGQYELHITGIGDTTVQPFQLDVAIQAMPQVTVTASADSVCEGTSVTLQAGGAANYEWSPVPGTGGSITFTPDSTTTYVVVGTTGACSDTAFGQVTVLQNTTGDTSAVVCDSFDWYGQTLTEDGDYFHTFTNAEGCDSVVTLQLTVGGMSDVTISTPHNAICSGGSVELKAIPDDAVSYSYLWNTGETTAMITDTPDQTTEYSVTVTDSYGCKDSASVTIMVSTTSVQTFYGNVCRGEAYEGYGFTLTEEETDTSGTLTLIHTATVGPGCISTTTLWLTVHEPSDTTINLTACDSLVWDGVTYYADTVLRDTLQNIHGCDSIVTVNLTVGSSPEVHITNPSPAAVCAGEEITLTAVTECWGLDTILYEGFDGLTGGNDSTTGSYGPGNTPLTFPLTDAFISGVKVYPAGDAIKLGNNSNTGSVTSNYLDLTQDFTVTIRAKGWIFNNNPKKTKIRVSTNPDNAQEFIVNGNSDFTDYSLAFSAAGANAQVMIETVNASGFDKRAFIDLVSITREVPCTYQWYTSTEVLGNDTVVTVTPPSTSWYYFTVPSPTGCERTDSVEVVVNSPVHTALSVIECDSYTWVDGDGVTHTENGDYLYPHEDANGCTQVDTLHLTIYHPAHQSYTVDTCGAYTWEGGTGTTYTASGDYMYMHKDENECWQVDTLHLTIHNPTHQSYTVDTCGAYMWEGGTGTTYTASGDYLYKHNDGNGCMQVDTLHLTIHNPTHQSYTVDTCGAYTWEGGTGQTYTTSGDHTYAHQDANGCTQVDTLHLTVKDTLLRHIYDTVCFNGGNYDSYGFELTEEEMSSTADTVLINLDMGANECDSMTVLHLTVFHPAHQSFTETAYDNYTWTSGNGNTYVQSGTYTYEHCDENGCTQNDTLYLTVHYTSSNVFSKDTCDSYNWDGRILTQTGTYDTIYTDQYGADSAVTLHLIIHHGTHHVDTVTACDSCVWNGSTYTEGGVYVYEYINSEDCPSADTLYLTIITTPDVIVSGPHVFCPDSSVTLTAVTETAPESYLWSNGATTSSVTVSEAGVYTVTAYYAGECSAVSAGFHVFETENPIVNGFLHDMVAGDTQTVVIGTMTDDNLQYILPQSTLTYSTVTFLPDGQSCDSIGCSYRAEMSFSGFPDTAVVHSADEIRYIRLNMEHSSPVDLYIRLICPDEQQADILRKHDDDSESECLSFIDGSHIGWPDGNVDQVYYDNLPYIRAWMGQPNIFFDDEVDLCDSSKNKPGVGWNYCWSDNTTEGYQYASANGCLVDTSNSIYYYNGGIQDLYHLSYIIMDSTDVAAGTQYYHPDESFDSLIGCHINGTWTIEVIDGITNDNGYIFECEMGVAEHLSATHYAHVSEMLFDGMWTGAGGTDSTFVIMPPEDLENDTTVAYTFTLIDENGCTFDTVIHINVYAHKHIDLYDTVNSSQLPLVWEGLTFNGAGCQDTLLHTVHGADSLVTLHLSVIYHYDTAVCANKTPLFWHNQTFYSTSSVTVSQSVESGCADSIEVLMVKVNPVFRDTLWNVRCANEPPFVWRGNSYSTTGTYYDSLVSVVTGCDSIYVLKLTVNPTFAVPLTAAICEGDTFQFFGQLLTEEGVYTETLQTVHGCDSVITLTLAVNPIYSISLADTICEGDTFHFFSQHLTETGVYTETLQTVHGCDSVFTLNLTVHPTYSIPLAETICQGDTFLFFGQPLTEEGVYTKTLQTVDGCDSVFTLSLTVHPAYSIPMAETICQGDTFLFFNQHLTETGVYTETLQTVHGCDSVFTLSLTVHPTYSIPLTDTICQGDTVHFFEQLLTETGVYTETLQTVDGCDSVFILSLTVNEIFHGVTDADICESDTPYVWRGNSYSVTGTYSETLSLPTACDSIFTLNLSIHQVTFADTFATACDSFVWRGVTYFETPIENPTDTLYGGSTSGCDSVTVLHLTIHHSAVRFDTVDICEGELPYTYGDTVFESGTLSGDFVFHDTTTYGCDSIVRLNLQVTQNIRTTQVPFIICEDHLPTVWNVPDTTHYIPLGTSGDTTIVDTFHFASNGCDSIVTRKLIIGTITDTTIVDTIVENQLPYWLNGKSYDSTGIYLDTVTNGNGAGCDIIITLDLTVFFNVRTPLDSIICNNEVPLIWNGLTFTETRMDSVVFVMDNGADSTVVMNVTVNDTSHYTLPISVLENNLPDTLNGFVYDTTGIYTQHLTNAVGCDSTLTIEFTVLYNVRTELYYAVCDGDIQWPYVWNGVEFTGPGMDSITVQAASGVDSTVVMTLVVNYPTAGTFADTVLENDLPSYQLNGFPYDSAGTYIQHLTNANGCDSTLTLELTVFFNDTITIDSTVCDNELGFYWNGVCFTEADTQSVVLNTSTGADSVVVMRVHVIESPDVTISGPPVFCADNFAQLTAVSATAISYHWSTGDTTQSINANVTGIYAVTVTNEYGCKDSDIMTLSQAVIVNPIASYQFPDLCAGNDYSITIGHQSISTIVLDNPESTLSWADTVFLPDGKNCPPYGCSYQSPLTFTDFAPGSVVSSVNDILYVRLNMEHSFAGDLYINLRCPNGQKADILKFDGTANSNCSSQIPISSRNWQPGNNADDGTFFGMAYDHSSTGNNACNPNTNNNAPGIGWNYCWSNNNNQGYTYAPGQGSLVYRSVNAHTHTNAYYSFFSGEDHYVDIFDSSNVAEGTKFYHPDQSFQNLVGCPLNGSWTIEVMDGWTQDNGYIFGWELALAPYLMPTPYSDVTFVWVEGPWVTTVSDTSFIFSPPDTLEHDTLVAYTFHLQDQYGCGYDTTVYLNVYAQSHTVIDTNVCASFDYNGVTYTQSETITWNGVNVHGCDSTCVINLTVYPMPTTAITGLPVPCVDDTAHLAAVCADPDALLVWSTGDTAQTITVTSSGDYTVTATNAKCSYDETVTVTFSSPNESTTDLTVCDSILWNGTVYTQTGSYVKTLTNAAGCDSVATLDLTVNYSYLNHDTLYLLQNQLPYYFAPHDTTFPYGSPSEFQFSYTLPAQNDCDSVIMEKVYVYMNYSHTFDTLVCASAVPLTWHGHTFTATGTVTDLLFTVHGSDSLLIYTVTVDTVSATIGNVTHINCYGESNGAATATVTGGVSPLTYQWTNGAGASVSSATLLNNRPAGDYKFTVTDAAGCSATDSVTINLLHGQMLPGTITGLQSLCHGDMLGTVTGTAATGDDCTYQWQMSTDGTVWAPLPGTNNTQNYLFQTPATSSFQLRRAWISTGCGTLYSDTLDISVWPVSNDTIHDNVCAGISYQNHGFDISEEETSLPGTLISEMHYSSQNGCDSSVTLVLAVNEPQETDFDVEICEGDGYYGNGFAIPPMETIGTDTLLRILNLNTTDGCDSVVRLEVTVIDTMLRIVSPTADFCEDVSAELIVETNMPDYEWSTGEMTPNIIVTSPGVYSVTATQGGCSVTARYTVEPCEFQLYLPNAITPGRTDRLNDYFCIPEGSRNAINLFEISIVNRWGELVFYSTDKNFVWNGEYKGRIFHQTVYNYIIEYTDFAGRQFRVTGSITVL